ncbi:ATP-binding protein [Natronobacterium texcoconense]|uniref:PD-(D/E)XK nuclease superfamily protein n=1 Tax=Natronobacterium texcoconense TaxID=1095778 RepID=A0A1H1G194_NATTX|nr:hypothetical protein [Natronobacterium texcoconense]SDR06829.1 hypothetical protein SAMN04489842_2206 [Natronobacterium texcoconense]
MVYPFSSPNGYEERLNQQFSGYLYYSLQISPKILNTLHENLGISFSKEATVVAHQNSPLPRYTESGTDRELDWVISDRDKLVGYESKYGDSLSSNQLQDELEKLELNVDGRDFILIVVTPHTTPPLIMDRFENEPVHWISWFTISRRLHQIEETEIQSEQRPILRMLRDLFEAEDMHPFTGFNHHDKLQYRYFIRDLRQELVQTELKNPGKVNTSTTNDPDPTSWKRLVPKRLDVPFVRESREDTWKRQRSYLTTIVDTETHEVHAGIVFNLREVESHRNYVADSLDELVGYASDRDLQLWASMNSLNQWEAGVPRTDDPSEMRSWLKGGNKNSVRVDGTNFKKAIFVNECSDSDPSETVQNAKNELLRQFEDFLVSDDLYPWTTLEGHE